MSQDLLVSTIPECQGNRRVVGRTSGTRNHLDILIAATLLALVSFSLPGRTVPDSATSLDLVGLFKVALRITMIAWFGVEVLLSIYSQLQQRVAIGNDNVVTFLAGFKWISPVLLPWMVFVIWSGMTLLWSPLKSVSAGQWLGLVALLVFAQVICFRYGAAVPNEGPNEESLVFWRKVIQHLTWVLFIYGLLVLTVHWVAPQYSGLDRSISYRGTNGFVHPTAAGATASLGLSLAAVMLAQRSWRRRSLCIFACLVHIPLLIYSASRAALAMAVFSILVCGLLLLGREVRALVFIGLGMVSMAVVVFDPGLEVVGNAWQGTSQYVYRGQTSDQLRAVSGRTEMWEAVWKEFGKSPIIGHGYFVTSETGQLSIWQHRANHDAHNILLQVLVSTGLVGGLLFSWAVLRSVWELLCLLSRSPRESKRRDPGWLLLIMGVWYAGWGQACVTFLGPIRPESVVFFGLLGLLAGSSIHGSGGLRNAPEGSPA